MRFSLLVAVRPNSPFIKQFVDAYERLTENKDECELLINDSTEYGLGRFGLHLYINDLIPKAKGDWLAYFCDDHEIIMPGWDRRITDFLHRGEVDKDFFIDPKKPHVIIPRADNTGTVMHILSRGFVEALGHISMHSHIDSYLNHVLMDFPGDRIHYMDGLMYTDHTVSTPAPQNQAEHGKEVVYWEDQRVKDWILEDQQKLKGAL